MYPALKTAMMGGGLGLFGAGVADMAAHDEMDRSAGSLQDLRNHAAGVDPRVMQVALQTVDTIKNPRIREVVMGAFMGMPPEQITAQVPDAPKEFVKMVKTAYEIGRADPQLAAGVVDIGMRMNAFDAEAAARGQDITQVAPALEAGAGESPLPAILGGAGLGSGGAILQHLLNRRGAALDAQMDAAIPGFRDSFKVRRS
jgi:hypothetical protein